MSWNKVGRVSSKIGSRRDHAAPGVRIAAHPARCVQTFSLGCGQPPRGRGTGRNDMLKFPIILGIRIDVFL